MLHALDLSGTWKAHWSDGMRGRPGFAEKEEIDPTRYVDAQVPGEIHLDLMKAGLIPDVYRGLGVLEARWVEEYIWSYRREFECPDEARLARAAWLVLDGVEMFARVVLNGREIARHANAFYPCRVRVDGLLRPGRNILCVHLDPGLYGVADRKAEGLARQEDELLNKRFWTRRIQSQSSWDWSPRLLNCGIQGGARLEWTDAPLRVDQFVPLASVSDDLQRGAVRLRVAVENLRDKPVTAVLTGLLPELKVTSRKEVTFAPGESVAELDLEYPGVPTLWWPAGCGEQTMHKAKVTLRVGDELIFTLSKPIGFRKVRVVREKVADGETYRFEINNRPVFGQGGNLVPCDLIGAAMTPQRYATLVDLALEANFNFLRIWGGGQYESDVFYDLCDRKGILVWQEFIFACMKYPVYDERFYDDVLREAKYNVRRLAHHPSLIAWCGNNELETALWNWGGVDRGHIQPDYGLFHYALPRMLGTEDPTRWYQPSSPYSFHPHINPHDHAYGDQHPWDIGFFDFDFRKYRTFICRFANEGGVLGPTSLPTLRDCLRGSDGRIGNFHWKQHDNGVDCWHEPSSLDTATELWLGRNLRDMTLEEYAFWGGLLQGEGLREYIDNFRRRRWMSSGAIFWMFNDVWPATRSWTIVDWNLNRTPAFHPVRRAMAPVTVVLAEDGDDVVIYGVSDRLLPETFVLRYGLFDTRGDYILAETRRIVLGPNASTPLARFPRKIWKDPREQIAFAVLQEEGRSGRVVARNRLILPLWKEMKWGKGRVSVRRDGADVVFSSDDFVLGVCVDLDGTRPLPDNFFDLYPGQPYRLRWPGRGVPTVRYVGNLASNAAPPPLRRRGMLTPEQGRRRRG